MVQPFGVRDTRSLQGASAVYHAALRRQLRVPGPARILFAPGSAQAASAHSRGGAELGDAQPALLPGDVRQPQGVPRLRLVVGGARAGGHDQGPARGGASRDAQAVPYVSRLSMDGGGDVSMAE